MLTSFFYAAYTREPTGTKRLAWLASLRSATARLIDSGAHTLRTTSMKIAPSEGTAAAKDVDYDAYLAQYIGWLYFLRRMGLADWWVEIDVGAVVGDAWLVAQRARLIAAGLGAGLIQVWHSDRDWDYWLYLLREACRPGRSRYVAIEGHQIDRKPLDYLRFVRAFKMTGVAELHRTPFYSVDSSSWTAGERYGAGTTKVRMGGCSTARLRKVPLGCRPAWLAGASLRHLTARERLDMLVKSAQAWVDAERRLTALWRRRGVDWDRAVSLPEVLDAVA